MPDNPAPHVVEWWMEIGPTAPDGAICWQEMAAWERLTGVELAPWEARAIRRMSSAFLAQRHEARKPNCPPPYTTDVAQDVRDNVTAQFAAMMAAFRKDT